MALGIDSLRPPLLAARAARAVAALQGASSVSTEHATLAARLVLAPRATRLPPGETTEANSQEAPPPPEPPASSDPQSPQAPPEPEEQALNLPSAEELQELMVAAVQASLSPGLLAMLRAKQSIRAQQSGAGKAGASIKNRRRGRPLGAMRGELRDGARLHVLATLRACTPWRRSYRSAP
jgi:magnesium chelatase subunit D